jgi:hypothetical protein
MSASLSSSRLQPLLCQLLSPGIPILWLCFHRHYLVLYPPFHTCLALADKSSVHYIGVQQYLQFYCTISKKSAFNMQK